MLTSKRKSNLKVVVYLAIHIIAATLVFGCEGRKSFYDNNRNDINLVPQQMENPEAPLTDDEVLIVNLDQTPTPPPVTDPELIRPTEPPKPASATAAKPSALTPTKPTAPAPTKPSPGQVSEPSRFIKVAFWVIQNEARKIGTPCNFYVSRVLELSGYSNDSFLANDFDIYARKHFSSSKNEIFSSSNIQAERLRLKRHIWSYPTRTPFIFQWERPNPKPGHIAIVERIGDQLVVYQASLNRHIARREQTSIDRLLNQARGARMTVYTDFIAR